MKKILLVLMVSLIVSVVVSSQVPMSNPPHERESVGGGGPHLMKGGSDEDFLEELDLTMEQQNKIVDLKFNFEQEVLPLRRDLQKKRLELKGELDKENIDKAKVERLSDEMSALHGKIQKARLNLLLSIKSVLTKEQWEKAKESFFEKRRERRKRMGLKPPKQPSPKE